MKTVKVADVTHTELQEFKEARQHTSFDSAIRELLAQVDNDSE